MNKTPKLRFKEFSGDWESKKIASVFNRVSKKVDVIEIEKYKQIGIRSHGKGIFYKDIVLGKELGNKRVFWVEPDVFIVNIVFAWEQAIAKTTKSEIGMIASHRFPMYKPKDKVLDLDYITQLFKTPKGKFLLGLASPGGAGRNKTLGQKEFDDLDITIPSYDEQKKISVFISLIDKKIEKQSEKVDALKDYKKGLMQKIFSQELRFKDDTGMDYSDWEEKKLGNLIDKGKAGGTPKSTVKDFYNGEINFLSISDITAQGKYITRTEKTITQLGLENSSAWLVPINSLIYSMYASVGFVSINKIELATSQAIFCMILNKNVNIDYVYHYLSYFRENGIETFIEKGTQGNLNANIVKNINVPYPDILEQKKIASCISSIECKVEKEQEKLNLLNEYKKGLLQQMFV